MGAQRAVTALHMVSAAVYQARIAAQQGHMGRNNPMARLCTKRQLAKQPNNLAVTRVVPLKQQVTPRRFQNP